MSTTPAIPTALNLGCGHRPFEGHYNVDFSDAVACDLKIDLNVRPWGLPSGHFRKVAAFDLIEHLDDTVGVMREVLRVCAPGAEVHFTFPHFSSANAYADPSHRRIFGAGSFAFFEKGGAFDFGKEGHFRTLGKKIYFHPSLPNKLVWRLANRFPEAYEKRWAWIFPAWFVEVRLEAIKSS